jgi:uncharacterized protein RhaS with RHS repeats
LVEATRDGAPELSCTWAGEHLDTCVDRSRDPAITMRTIRDGSGRLTAVTAGERTIAIARDGDGNITHVGEVALGYDDARRVIAVGRVTIEYDDDGRAVRERDGGGEHAYEYDAQGRLGRFAISPESAVSFRYDEQGRLATVRSGGPLEDTITYTHFAYDCAAAP